MLRTIQLRATYLSRDSRAQAAVRALTGSDARDVRSRQRITASASERRFALEDQ
jgi:hypothetical protein